MSGSAVAAQKLDLQSIGGKQLDDGPNVSLLNFRILRYLEHGYHVQKFQLSSFGHVERPVRVRGLGNIAGDQTRYVFVGLHYPG